ncbi:MAG TPA: S-layer protein [Candidatus Methanofastidiosa archaeon]|nr:S-layer protein [Candidatus Methanofastidiosa archaeon]HPR41045.1 S-layer protein [Candidatus Methanofastidiosa archaeon]
MKWKKIGVAVSGAILLGSTLMGAVGAATDAVDKDFFINSEDGQPSCLIVVGTNAAAEDVVSASWIAAQIGSMAYYTTTTPQYDTYTSIVYEEEDTANYIAGSGIFEGDLELDDFRLSELATGMDLDTPESWALVPFACNASTNGASLISATSLYRPSIFGQIDPTVPLWDYDVYMDANTEETFLEDTGCSIETISIDFSIRDVTCSQQYCIDCTAACDQMGYWWFDANENQAVDTGEIDDFDSLAEAYPEDVADFVPIDDTLAECQTYPNIYPRMYWGSPSWQNICDPVGGMEYRAIVYGMDTLTSVTWQAIIGSADQDSEAYEICSDVAPQPVDLYCDYCEVYFLGETYNALSFGTNSSGVDYMFYGTPNWYVEEKLKVGESKTYGDFTLTINDLGIYENKAYITIEDSDGEAHDYVVVIDTYTSNIPSVGDGDNDNEENDTIAFYESTCGTSEVVFAVKFVKTLIGAAGNYVVEYHAYNLDDMGCLTEKIFPDECADSDDDLYQPFVVADCNGEYLDWYLDIIPSDDSETDPDGVQTLDLDNDFDLWLTSNPNFDASDNFVFYNVGARTVYSEYNCVPVLELWLATPVELAGMCSDEFAVCLDDREGNEYLSLQVSDTIHTDYVIDGYVKVTQRVEKAPLVSTTYVNIDPTTLVALDTDVDNDPELKNQYNLILVGGPVANSLVQDLIDLEFTTFAEWDTSSGDAKLYEDVYAFGKDVLVVAGKDRTATAKAALDLIHELQDL